MSERDTAATPSPEDRAASLHAVARALRGRVTWGRRRDRRSPSFSTPSATRKRRPPPRRPT